MRKLRAVVVYDSVYGNTRKVAEAIAEGIRYRIDVETVKAMDTRQDDMLGCDLLVVGSPTHGGRPTQAIQDIVSGIPQDGLKGIHVCSFDTRFSSEDHNIGLRLLMRLIGFAAEKIDKLLVEHGGTSKLPVYGFIVQGREGPLREGELNRAREWGRSLSIYMMEYKEQELAA